MISQAVRATIDDQWPVYPGHPLVLAVFIMDAFDTFEAANARTKHGWCAALGDGRIPGAGDHVGGAMRCLAIGASGGSVAEMIAYADEYWTGGNAGGHHKAVPGGQAQALMIESRFRELAVAWFATSPK